MGFGDGREEENMLPGPLCVQGVRCLTTGEKNLKNINDVLLKHDARDVAWRQLAIHAMNSKHIKGMKTLWSYILNECIMQTA